jgi:FAD/FMN-containing dehydrogenase
MASFSAIHREGNPFEFDSARVDALRGALRGPLIGPNDAGYHEARAIWNAMIDRRPALVARCSGTADIIACVDFARDTGIAFSIKGGGHNIAGLALVEGGLLIDCSQMRGAFVDAEARIAHAQPGCTLGDVDRETQVHGLAAVLGFVSPTGVAGLTLGGGFGYTSRRFGYTSDNVRSMTLVTADGRLVRASEQEHPDLFWALRGGGGNFGVVTDIELELHPLGPEIYGGAMAWPAERAGDVFGVYHAIASNAPPELAVVCLMRIAPPAPWIDKASHGKPIVAMFVCHTGKPEDGEKLMTPARTLGKPVGNILQRRSYVSQQSLLDATQPKGRRYYWKSEYLPRIGDDIYASVQEHAARIVSPHSAVILFPLGGAVGEHPTGHSAVGNRNAEYVLNVAASWDRPDDDAANIEWARSTWRDMRRYSTGGTYVNFLTEEESGERIQAAYGENYARLVRVKAEWDPRNMFRANKNLAPAG